MDAHHLVQVSKNPNIPEFRAGDTVQVNYKVREGERTRTQPFVGVVIRRMGGKSPAAGFTVRRVTRGFGVERTFPLYSPTSSPCRCSATARSAAPSSTTFASAPAAPPALRNRQTFLRG